MGTLETYIHAIMKICLTGLLMLPLVGCTLSINPDRITVAMNAAPGSLSSGLGPVLCVGSISGFDGEWGKSQLEPRGSIFGGEVSPTWTVGDTAFRLALEASLKSGELLAVSGCRYQIDARLLRLSRGVPMHPLGYLLPLPALDKYGDPKVRMFDEAVTAEVSYRVNAQGEPPVFQDTIITRHTEDYGTRPFGNPGVRRAAEGAIRANIGTFLARLRDIQPAP